MKKIGLLLSFMILLFACSEYEVTQTNEIQFKNLNFDYSDNSLNEHINSDLAALGRVLFYDNLLSRNGNVSCATCHKQELAFADDVALSEGFVGGLTDKNTPSLINLRFGEAFFWDARTNRLKDAVRMPIFDHKEMGMDITELEKRIQNTDYYGELFKKAFGGEIINTNTISQALSSFVGSIISVDSKLDAHLKANSATILTPDEKAGLDLFEEHCNQCHTALGDAVQSSFANDDPYMGTGSHDLVSIGLPKLHNISDPFFDDRVRIPSLRNISSTAPYMHDGRFETLLEVIDHYNDGVEEGPFLDFRLREFDGSSLKIKELNLTDKEKDQLVLFLETLSDDRIETDEKWSDPFIR